jgi:hypothetical protein
LLICCGFKKLFYVFSSSLNAAFFLLAVKWRYNPQILLLFLSQQFTYIGAGGGIWTSSSVPFLLSVGLELKFDFLGQLQLKDV